jgi:hypothetical protein
MPQPPLRAAVFTLTVVFLAFGVAHSGLASAGHAKRPHSAGKRCAKAKARTEGKRRRHCKRGPKNNAGGANDPSPLSPAAGGEGTTGDNGTGPSLDAAKPLIEDPAPELEEPVEELPIEEPPVEEPVEELPVEEPPVDEPPVEDGGISSSQLRWPRPTLIDPTTISLGNGYTETKLDPTKDYIIDLPSTKKVGATLLMGGHNIVIVGGSITIPTGTTWDAERRGIYVKDATGTVHIEGVLIDGSGGGYFDGIGIAAPEATVQLENDRIVGVKGGFEGFHGDIVQPWGGVRDLRIDHLTGKSGYQGLTLVEEFGPIGSAEISNVDLTYTASPEPRELAGGYMLWLTSDNCKGYPIQFSEVYIRPRADRTLGTSVWPPDKWPTLACHAESETDVTWPNLPITGAVREGPAPKSFVPAGAAGIAYESSG